MQEKENPLNVIVRRLMILIRFVGAGIKVNALKPYWHDSYVVRTNALALALNAANWLYLYQNRTGEGFPLILHYNLFFGVDTVGEFGLLYTLPTVGLILLALNAVLGQAFFKLERLASYLLTLTALIVQLFLLLASHLLIMANR